MKGTAVITTARGFTQTVTVQREHEGSYWATAGQQNSDHGYTLRANGDAYRETYRNGERTSSTKVGTWVLGTALGTALKPTSRRENDRRTREFVERLRAFCIEELGAECEPSFTSGNAGEDDDAWTIEPTVGEMKFNVEVFGPYWEERA